MNALLIALLASAALVAPPVIIGMSRALTDRARRRRYFELRNIRIGPEKERKLK